MNSPEYSGNILVVDDQDYNRYLMKQALSREGYYVIEKASGIDALEYLQQHPVDLVLMDIMMPEMDGLEVLSILREEFGPMDLPVIIVTARTASKEIAKALEIGANDYIVKPIDLVVTRARMKTQLSLKRARQELREKEKRFELVVSGATDGIWDWNLVQDEIYLSPRLKAMLGYGPSELSKSPEEWLGRIHPDDRVMVEAKLEACKAQPNSRFEIDFRMIHKDSSKLWLQTRGSAIWDETNQAVRLVGAQTNITHTKAYDPITGLYSRDLFCDRLAHVITLSKRRPDMLNVVLVISIDTFERLRDILPTEHQHELLQSVGKRLSDAVLGQDSLARFGGDEFVLLCEDLKGPQDAVTIVNKIRRAMETPIGVDDLELFVTFAFGIVFLGPGSSTPDIVLRNAYAAMDEAKHQGKNCYQLFDRNIHDKAVTQLKLESDIRGGIRNQEFFLTYQPIVDLKTRRIVACEALIRWRRHDRIISPALFIPAAEQSGLIVEIGSWVTREACRQAKAWRDQGLPAIKVAVNFSAHQFMREDFLTNLADTLLSENLDPGALKLEVTETALIMDPARTKRLLTSVRDMGIEIALDDFGTGYSSLSYLRQFPIDILKVDQSFIFELTADEDNTALVAAILQMAKTLKIKTTCEGIETAEHLAVLQDLGADQGQGYYFAKPLPADEFAVILAKGVI